MSERRTHEWRKDWSDGKVGRIECDQCKAGLLLPVGDLGWWSAKPKKEL
jgi:hypothetical protein